MIFLNLEMTHGYERIDEKSKNCTFIDELSFLVFCLHLVVVIFVGKRYIDHFHKWQRIFYSFVFMLIRPTGLTLV